MELKNKELVEELDNLLLDLSEEQIESNEELKEYFDFSNDVEVGDVPFEEYEKYDDVETLTNLINIAKGL